jgi:phosphopantetheine adenylyltransferase
MFSFNIEFRVVVQHTYVAALNVATALQSLGVAITELREADIVADADGSKHGSTYIVCCEGSRYAYHKFMKEYSMDEIMYEGVKTLI